MYWFKLRKSIRTINELKRSSLLYFDTLEWKKVILDEHSEEFWEEELRQIEFEDDSYSE